MRFLVLVLAVTGCGEFEPSDPSASITIHVDPPHWPSDLPDAVGRLDDGQHSVRDALAGGRSDDARDHLLPVVRDLARWLPQVAADSDLPEPEWNRVNGIAGRILPIYDAIQRDLDRGRAVDRVRLSDASPLLDELRQMVEGADPAWFAPLPMLNRSPSDEPRQDEIDESTTLDEDPTGPPEDDTTDR